MDHIFQTKAEAADVIGQLSSPGKMPGTSYNLPTTVCNVGGKLREVEDSPCFKCYAHDRGAYAWPIVKAAGNRRLERLLVALADPREADRWVAAFARLLTKPEHRWQDAGDLISVDHLRLIARVCEATPNVRHWLPTQERAILRRYATTYGDLPANLTVRISMPRIDTFPTSKMAGAYSMVATGAREVPADVHVCPSTTDEHRARRKDRAPNCADCRACWSPDVKVVAYPVH